MATYLTNKTKEEWQVIKDHANYCPLCAERDTLEVTRVGMEMLRNGVSVEEAFPKSLTGDQQQLLVTGFHPKCTTAPNMPSGIIKLMADREVARRKEIRSRMHKNPYNFRPWSL